MTKSKLVSATLAAAIVLSSTVAFAGNKRSHGIYKPTNTMQDASSATAAQRSGATLQAGGGSSGDGGGPGGG
jgi:hypothetical protein